MIPASHDPFLHFCHRNPIKLSHYIMDQKEIKSQNQTVVSDKMIRAYRSVPNTGLFYSAVVFSALHYLGIVAGITTLIVFYYSPTKLATDVFIACVIYSVITWIVSYYKRKAAYCPLCKGTPLINSGAHAHIKAIRLFPLNHGVTAIFSIIATHRFRCMYCGTGFDMLRPSSTRMDQNDSEIPPH